MNVLFLCTGNSARSILAEAMLNRIGAPHWRAYSAGSQPKGEVHPLALAMLRSLDYPVSDLESKSWDRFAAPDAPPIDVVVTVCDSAAREPCPVWPGHPLTAHWGIPDPAAAQGDDVQRREAFARAWRRLHHGIAQLVELSPQDAQLREKLDEIGRDLPGVA